MRLKQLLCIGGLCVFYFIHQIRRHPSYPSIYYESLQKFRSNPGSIWLETFSYLIEPDKVLESAVCTSAKDDRLSLLIVITSTIDRGEQRRAIRSTWASYFAHSHNGSVEIIFVIGNGSKLNQTKQLRKEIERYKDLLIIDLVDTYHNLSLKILCAYRWIAQRCPGARLIMKTDDDAFVFGENLMRYLYGYYNSDKGMRLGRPAVHCFVLRFSQPRRASTQRGQPLDKSFVPWNVYPGNYYPYYCSGHAYILTHSAITSILHEVAKLYVYMHLEDVLFTGIIAERGAICRVDRKEFRLDRFSPEVFLTKYRRKEMYQDYFTIHYVKSGWEMSRIWENYQAAV